MLATQRNPKLGYDVICACPSRIRPVSGTEGKEADTGSILGGSRPGWRQYHHQEKFAGHGTRTDVDSQCCHTHVREQCGGNHPATACQ